ncbi:MAG: NAD(P)-dependent dehydrogenase (short-subunit alcohol dehydrogenase family) [Granulosicoccus sp.]|jgi:NAD(P)-dependent dehydrogenase (short-subunit alcohol dehydrogenase family)
MTQRSVLITGCSSGIGLDAARTLSARGWHVLATCRKETDCQLLRAEGLDSFPLDYDDSQSISQGVLQAMELTNGKLDALFNNGAYAIPGLVEDLPRDALRAIFETNLFGQFELINEVLPIMRKQGHGRIINCSSVLGFAAQPFRGSYNASKFAMEGLSDTLRLELDDSPVHIILIEPGPIKTLIRQNSIAPFERWVNWQLSHQRERYEKVLCPRLYTPSVKKDRFELPPSAVTEKLIHALESARPRPRYYVTTPTYLAGFLKRILGTRWFDRVLLR